MHHESMHIKSVHLFIHPRLNFLDMAGLIEVFSAANRLARLGHEPYTISILALNKKTDVWNHTSMETETLQPDTSTPHTLIIPGGPGIQNFCKDPRFHTHFVKHANKAERLISVGTGVLALARAGKIDGRKVTTHWSAYDELEETCPSALIQRGPIYINDGPIWTSAGIASGIDLALSIVEEDLGYSVALEIARHLVIFLKRPGNQNQFSSLLNLQSKSSQFSDLHAWIHGNLSTNLSVPALANFMKMSERTFTRKYTESTGKTPGKMVDIIRLEAALDILAYSNSPLKTIAQHCGLGSESTLIRKFARRFGITPKKFRSHLKSTQ
ncbi:GlxA family transcriptional regulator [Pseudomonas fluorescens]